MKPFITALLFLMVGARCMAQITTEPRTEEYATVKAVVSAQTGTFSKETSLPNPFLEMETAGMELKDIVRDSKGVKFENVTEMINYMNKFGWVLHSSESLAINNSKTNDYLILYTFKRKSKTK
jgi:hypothetical protein